MKLVVTGASGFVGQAVLRRLRADGADVVGVARRTAPGVISVPDYAESPPGDVLIHLAEASDRAVAAAGGPQYEARAHSTLATLLRQGYSRVVYASSAALYGDRITRPRRPDEPLLATDAYARIKIAAEEAVLAAGGVVARLSNLYGPGMSSANVLSRVLAQIPGRGALRVRDDTPVRDFLWIDDAASALGAMAGSRSAGAYNVGTSVGTSVRGLAEAALALAGESDRPVLADALASQPSHLVVDIAATRDTFGWQPATTLADGLAHLNELRTRTSR